MAKPFPIVQMDYGKFLKLLRPLFFLEMCDLFHGFCTFVSSHCAKFREVGGQDDNLEESERALPDDRASRLWGRRWRRKWGRWL